MPARSVGRSISVGLFVSGLALWLLAGCAGGGGGGGGEETQAAASISGVFVGQISGADELIAIVADEPESAGGVRRVRAYVCDGRPEGVAEWFRDSVAGNDIDLTSAASGSPQGSTARLQTQLSDQQATGTFALGDGSSYGFSAPAARDGAGLYTVTNDPEGNASGTSTQGEKFEAVHHAGGLVDNTITLLDGSQITYRTHALVEGSGEPDTYALIVLPNGELDYGRSIKQSGGQLSSFGSMFYAQSR